MFDDRWTMFDDRCSMDDDRWTMTCSAVYLRRQMKRLRGSVDETAYFGLEKRRRKDSFMSGLRHYKQLDAWKLAMTLVESTQVEVARRLRYVNVDQTRQLDAELERVLQMLYGMRREHLRRVALGGATAFLIFISCVITAG
jgi:hypothetical protein